MKPRSTQDETNGLRYFPRMLDKIRLHAEGKLDADYRWSLRNTKTHDTAQEAANARRNESCSDHID